MASTDKTKRHIIHKHTTKGYNTREEIIAKLKGTGSGNTESSDYTGLRPGEIALNIGEDRPSLVFFAKHKSISPHDEDTNFDRLIELRPNPYVINTGETDNAKPEIFEDHTRLDEYIISGFTVKLSDSYVEPVSAVTLQPGTTLDEAIGQLVLKDKQLQGQIDDLNAVDYAIINNTSVATDTEFNIGKINGTDIVTENGPANNFNFSTIDGSAITAVNTNAKAFKFAKVNGSAVTAYDEINVPMTTVEAGDGIVIATSQDGINNVISYAGNSVVVDGRIEYNDTAHTGQYISSIVVESGRQLTIKYAQDTAKFHKVQVIDNEEGNVISSISSGTNQEGNHTIVVHREIMSDSATTKEGHYQPWATTGSVGSSVDGDFIKTITLDEKDHVIGFTSGSETTLNAALTETGTTVGMAMTGLSVSGHQITPAASINLKVSGLTNDGTNFSYVQFGKTGVIALTSDIDEAINTALAAGVNYKGTTLVVPQTAKTGDLYIAGGEITITASESGTGSGQTAENGDFIIYNGSTWDVIQKNVDGAVTSTGTLLSDYVILGDGDKKVKVSNITLEALVKAVNHKIVFSLEGSGNTISSFQVGENDSAGNHTIVARKDLTVATKDHTISFTVSGDGNVISEFEVSNNDNEGNHVVKAIKGATVADFGHKVNVTTYGDGNGIKEIRSTENDNGNHVVSAFTETFALPHSAMVREITIEGVSGNAVTSIQFDQNIDGTHVISYKKDKMFSLDGHKHVSADIEDSVDGFSGNTERGKLLKAEAIEKMITSDSKFRENRFIVSDGNNTRNVKSVPTRASATTTSAGTQASAHIQVTEDDVTFGFEIPRGDKGERGYGVDRIDAPQSINTGSSQYNIYTAYSEDNRNIGAITVYNGAAGANGADGVGISSVNAPANFNTGSSESNTYTIMGTDNLQKGSFMVFNGAKGEKGDNGKAITIKENMDACQVENEHGFIYTGDTQPGGFQQYHLYILTSSGITAQREYEDFTDVGLFAINGVGISGITATSNTGSSEANNITVTLTDGTPYTFVVYNGGQGEQGIQGIQGIQGVQGYSIDSVELSGNTLNTGSSESNTYKVITNNPDNTAATVGTFTIFNGAQGEQGIQGIQGIGFSAITLDGAYATGSTQQNTYKVYNTEHTEVGTIVVTNGEKGDKGDKGDVGRTLTIVPDAASCTEPNAHAYIYTGETAGSYVHNHLYVYVGIDENTGNQMFNDLGEFAIEGRGIESITSSRTDSAVTITITLTDGVSSAYTVYDGAQGIQGIQGVSGVGVSSITSSRDGSAVTVTTTLTNGVSSSYTVYDGIQGIQGIQGVSGIGISSVTTAATQTGKSGTVVTIRLTDNSVSSFTVYDGADIDETNFYDKNQIDVFLSGISGTIIDNEYVVATALNDLNSRMSDSATTYDGHYEPTGSTTVSGARITGITYDGKGHITSVTTAATDDTDTKVADATGDTKAYLLGHTATTSTAETISNNKVYMSGGTIYINGTEVATKGDLSDSDEKVKDVASSNKAYLLGHANTGTTATTLSNDSVYMSGGTIFINGDEVAVKGDLTGIDTDELVKHESDNTVNAYLLGVSETNGTTSGITSDVFMSGDTLFVKGGYEVATIDDLTGFSPTDFDEKVKTATADTKAYLVGKTNTADTASGLTNSKVYMSGGTIYINGDEVAVKNDLIGIDTDEMVKYAYDKNTVGYLLGVSASAGTSSAFTSDVYMSNDGVYASYGFYQTSDANLKNFGEDVYIDFGELKSIPKKYFTWKEGTDSKRHIGTSAQELQKVYPELVRKGPDDRLSVDYASLSVIALAAVDELKKENDELKKRIEKIEEYLTQKNGK